MIAPWQFRLLTALGGLALVLALANGALFLLNRSGQAALNEGQQFVQQTAPLEALYRDIVKTLAETAIRGNDRQVLDMLAAQGLHVTVDGAAAKADK